MTRPTSGPVLAHVLHKRWWRRIPMEETFGRETWESYLTWCR